MHSKKSSYSISGGNCRSRSSWVSLYENTWVWGFSLKLISSSSVADNPSLEDDIRLSVKVVLLSGGLYEFCWAWMFGNEAGLPTIFSKFVFEVIFSFTPVSGIDSDPKWVKFADKS